MHFPRVQWGHIYTTIKQINWMTMHASLHIAVVMHIIKDALYTKLTFMHSTLTCHTIYIYYESRILILK